MNSINITGRITNDPELRVTQGNYHVMDFRLAVKDGKDKEGNEKTIFINCQAWRSNADYLSEHATKGSLLAISGSLKQDRYQNRDGQMAEKIYINVNDVQILSHWKEDLMKRNDENGYAPNKFGGDRSGLGNSIGIEDSDLEFY